MAFSALPARSSSHATATQQWRFKPTRWLRDSRQPLGVAALMAAAASVISISGAIGVVGDRPLQDVLAFSGRVFLEQAAVAVPVAFALVRAERLAVNGWRRHLLTIAIAAAVSLVVDGAYMFSSWPVPPAGVAFGVAASPGALLLYSLWKTVALALLARAYIHSSGQVRLVSEHLARLRQEQVAARRRLVEGRLAAIQARVDPQFFFDMLDAVQRTYAEDSVRAEHLLEELIAFLRAALPRLRTMSSTVSRECDLACSYVRLRVLANTAQAQLDAEVTGDATAAPFPPGVLLPLVEGVLRAAPAQCALHLAAAAYPEGVSVRISAFARPDAGAVTNVRNTLAELFGGHAGLEFATARDGRELTTVRVPHAIAA
jgi:hypothetical protein